MKRKAKVRRSRDLPPSDMSETPKELPSSPATPGRISIESVDEHKTGSIESVPQNGPENGIAGFVEPGGSDTEGARSPHSQP
ncbi:MAG: hypothetical protein ACRC2B_01055 [Rubrivivax sp.]